MRPGWPSLPRGLSALAAATLLFFSSPLLAEVRVHHFPVPSTVKQQARFWEAIFKRYPATSVVIHDALHPHIVIDIIDYKVFADRFKQGRPYTRREMEQVTQRYMKRYQLAIDRLKKEGPAGMQLGAMEKRVHQVYSEDKAALAHMFSGKVQLRAQRGLADDFKIAVSRAKNYLPYMEKTFREKGLPVDLTRIVFVESMFDISAVSKVGASGIWQFMPETAHHFLVLNPFVDERNSPFKATHAAAKLLQQNFELLKNWPLAITAYNHGTAGIQRAVKTLKTRDLEQIIRSFRSPTFGFASRNYYGEFIAARNVYNAHYYHYEDKSANPLNVRQVRIPTRMTISQLIKLTDLDESTLKKYNKCLKASAFNKHRDTPLPSNFVLTIPKEKAPSVERAFSKLGNYAQKPQDKGTSVWKR